MLQIYSRNVKKEHFHTQNGNIKCNLIRKVFDINMNFNYLWDQFEVQRRATWQIWFQIITLTGKLPINTDCTRTAKIIFLKNSINSNRTIAIC